MLTNHFEMTYKAYSSNGFLQGQGHWESKGMWLISCPLCNSLIDWRIWRNLAQM